MTRFRALVLFLSLEVSAIIACHGTLTPPSGPNTPYPCGIRGVECANGACCDENNICGEDGPFSRCEPGYCCYDGPHWPGSSADAGARKTRQHPRASSR